MLFLISNANLPETDPENAWRRKTKVICLISRFQTGCWRIYAFEWVRHPVELVLSSPRGIFVYVEKSMIPRWWVCIGAVESTSKTCAVDSSAYARGLPKYGITHLSSIQLGRLENTPPSMPRAGSEEPERDAMYHELNEPCMILKKMTILLKTTARMGRTPIPRDDDAKDLWPKQSVQVCILKSLFHLALCRAI